MFYKMAKKQPEVFKECGRYNIAVGWILFSHTTPNRKHQMTKTKRANMQLCIEWKLCTYQSYKQANLVVEMFSWYYHDTHSIQWAPHRSDIDKSAVTLQMIFALVKRIERNRKLMSFLTVTHHKIPILAAHFVVLFYRNNHIYWCMK